MQRFRQEPWHVSLLPLFFVLNACTDFFGSIPLADAIVWLAGYIAAALALTWLFYRIFRNKAKAGILTLLVMGGFFFFSNLQAYIRRFIPVPFLATYAFLAPLYLLFLTAVFLHLKKKARSVIRLTAYFNVLFSLFVLLAMVRLAPRFMHPDEYRLHITAKKLPSCNPCDTCARPDVFFLLMDEYASSFALKDQYCFDNDLDSFLVQQGFRIQKDSRSNYNYTVFSMASILNMSYIEGIRNIDELGANDHGNCARLIRNNRVVSAFREQGYTLVQYSPFDVDDQPAGLERTFGISGGGLISMRTLYNVFQQETMPALDAWFTGKALLHGSKSHYAKANNTFRERVLQMASPAAQPRFVYAHFIMPHAPFYYDKYGNPVQFSTDTANVPRQTLRAQAIQAYLDYVVYTNSKIREMIRTIRQKNPDAVIVLMGDHGFRDGGVAEEKWFQNLNAIYFPDRDYSGLYDSISGVNQFRVVFNKLFSCGMPMLPDRSLFIRNKW